MAKAKKITKKELTEINEQQNALCITPSHHNHALNSFLGITLDMDHLVVFKL